MGTLGPVLAALGLVVLFAVRLWPLVAPIVRDSWYSKPKDGKQQEG
ncbi:MAG: hypothetical protein JWM89_608 [Acidimicrobiales bacterium]|nr:hypothetical protein [Acidimicrobiales bacterium]